MVKVISQAGSGLGFSFEVRAWTEIEIWCVEGIYRLKLVSSEKLFKGLRVRVSVRVRVRVKGY